jgi:hypothetical protein
MSTRPLLPVLLCLLLAGCVVGDGPDDAAMTAPTFAPEEEQPADVPVATDGAAADEPVPDTRPDADAADGRDDGAAEADTDGAARTDERAAAASQPARGGPPRQHEDRPRAAEAPEAPVLRGVVSDPRGDVETLRIGSPPRHADLVGGTLLRDGQGYRLTIEVDGGMPEHARDGDHTMNVASFYDITGDGHIDVEVWANLADGGWDTARYDNRSGTAAFSDEDGIEVSVVDRRLVLELPLDVLDGAERLRWAVASEWGRYEELGTPMSARDEMPDDGAPAPFPG